MGKLEHLVVIPFVDCWEGTRQAIEDALAQSVKPHVLAIDNGSGREARREIDQLALEEPEGRLLVWHHDPPLPSLSATWNRALRAAWEMGLEQAMVCNNDVRLHPDTLACLKTALLAESALFVSAIGVTWEQWEGWDGACDYGSKGGPDFSCYLVSKECHERFPFDEEFVPCYAEDLSQRRMVLLAGEGHRQFSINLPFWHRDGGSGTIKSWDPERRAQFNRAVEAGSRAYYQRLWGGRENQECWNFPFNRQPTPEGVCTTTPDLEAHMCAGGTVGQDCAEWRAARGEADRSS